MKTNERRLQIPIHPPGVKLRAASSVWTGDINLHARYPKRLLERRNKRETRRHRLRETDRHLLLILGWSSTEIVNAIHPERSALLSATDSPPCCYWQPATLFSVQHYPLSFCSLCSSYSWNAIRQQKNRKACNQFFFFFQTRPAFARPGSLFLTWRHCPRFVHRDLHAAALWWKETVRTARLFAQMKYTK